VKSDARPLRSGRRSAALSLACAAVGLLTLTGEGASAHHGVTGRYDAGHPISITGTVVRTTFSPPHPVMTIRVAEGPPPGSGSNLPRDLRGPVATRRSDIGQLRTVEFTPADRFYALRSRVKPGDKVQLIAMRNCLPPHQLRSWWLRLPGGQVVVVNGDWARKVARC
jgi:hypothetical protein